MCRYCSSAVFSSIIIKMHVYCSFRNMKMLKIEKWLHLKVSAHCSLFSFAFNDAVVINAMKIRKFVRIVLKKKMSSTRRFANLQSNFEERCLRSSDDADLSSMHLFQNSHLFRNRSTAVASVEFLLLCCWSNVFITFAFAAHNTTTIVESMVISYNSCHVCTSAINWKYNARMLVPV